MSPRRNIYHKLRGGPIHWRGGSGARHGGLESNNDSEGQVLALDDKVWLFGVLSTLTHEWDARLFCQYLMRLLRKGVLRVLRNTLRSPTPPEF